MSGIGIGVAAVVGVGVFIYVGGLSRAKVKEDELALEGPVMLKLYVGPYGATAGDGFKEARKLLQKKKGEEVRLIALFYDDRKKMREELGSDEMCRAMVGIVLDDVPEDRRAEVEEAMLAAGYSKHSIPKTRVVKSSWKLRTVPFRRPSNIIFIRKAYPKLRKYCSEKELPYDTRVEVYNGRHADCMSVADEAVVAEIKFPEVCAFHPEMPNEKSGEKDSRTLMERLPIRRIILASAAR